MTDDLVERVRRNARGYDPGFDPTPLLNEVECELVRLRAAIIKGHWDAYPQPEEVRVPPYGEPDIECATCAGKWPCYAAEALGEQL